MVKPGSHMCSIAVICFFCRACRAFRRVMLAVHSSSSARGGSETVVRGRWWWWLGGLWGANKQTIKKKKKKTPSPAKRGENRLDAEAEHRWRSCTWGGKVLPSHGPRRPEACWDQEQPTLRVPTCLWWLQPCWSSLAKGKIMNNCMFPPWNETTLLTTVTFESRRSEGHLVDRRGS